MKNKYLYILLTLVVLLFLNTGVYSKQNNEQSIQKKSVNKSPKKITKKSKKFIPTEKIKADTSVPFPVDI